MPKLDFNIYGLDETSDAAACASRALGSPDSNRISGAPVDNSAKSVSSSDKSLKLDVESEQAGVKIISDRSDGRARTSGNHGKQG